MLGPRSRRRTLAVCLVALMAACAAASEAPATTTGKQYTLNVSPSSVGAGSSTRFSATFANLPGQQQQLGSANLTVPAGFTLVAAEMASGASGTVTASGNTVQLRNLALQPGSSLTVYVTATAPCAATTGTWSGLAKQSNDFNGPPGNNFTIAAAGSSLTATVTGACALRFVTQPANARVGAAISGTAYTPPPTGPGVGVETIDGAGNRVTTSGTPITMAIGTATGLGALSGTTTVNTTAGVATFTTLAINAPGTYTLSASSPGLTSASSNVFRIDTVVVSCTEDVSCSGTVQDSTTRLDVTADPTNAASDAGVLTLSFGTGFTLDCAGYTEFSPDTALVTYSTETRAKTAVLTIDKKQMNLFPNNGASFMQFCFGSPQTFKTASGADATVQGSVDWDGNGTADPVYVGLLPDCGVAPCVSRRNKTGAGDGVLTALLPAGPSDPYGRG